MRFIKKAWNDIKSFVTVVMTIAFIVFTFLKYISGEQFYSLFQIVIAFYFGTQAEKLKQYTADKNQQENTINNDNNGVG